MSFSLSLQAQQGSTFIEKTNHKFSKAEKLKLGKLNTKSFYKNIKHIKINKLSKFINRGYLEFSLPDQEEIFIAETKYINAKDDNDYYWHGAIQGRGFISIQKDENGISGNITVDEKDYSIINISKNKAVISELSNLENTECLESLSDHGRSQEAETKEPYTTYRAPCNTTEISVLIAYTTAAQNNPLNQVSIGNQVINDLNAIASNSGIGNDVSFSVNQILHVPGFSELETDLLLEIERLFVNQDLINARNSAGADLVLVLTDFGYNSFGVARIQASSNEAFAIAQIEHAAASLTGAHEIIHMIGGRHQRCNVTGTAGCANIGSGIISNAHGWLIDPFNTTLMHNPSNTASRQMHLSNPNVNFTIGSGAQVPTGTYNTNVANKVKNRADNVACFKSTNLGNIQAYITGPTMLDVGINYTWNSDVTHSNVTLPLSYKWEISTNGISGWTILSYASSYTANSGNMPPYFVLRLTVTSPNGVNDVDLHPVNNDDIMLQKDEVSNRVNDQKNQSILITPNPAFDAISFLAPAGEYDIFSISGVKIKTLKISSERIEVNIKDWKSGVYFIRSKESFQIEKFIKI